MTMYWINTNLCNIQHIVSADNPCYRPLEYIPYR